MFTSAGGWKLDYCRVVVEHWSVPQDKSEVIIADNCLSKDSSCFMGYDLKLVALVCSDR